MQKLMSFTLIAVLITACATSPLGRRQLLLMPADQVAQMGVTAYAQMKAQQPLSGDTAINNRVQCVSNALLSVVGDASAWEVTVFQDAAANAFALPGQKIGVNDGLLNVAVSPDQLAAVIGHEIGHVQAQHGNERMSVQFATQTGLQLLNALSGEGSEEKALVIAALGAGAQFGVVLPFSRSHESEADLIGLELMARAGFDPRASVALWQNMAAASNGAPPELLSTHPAHDTRIRDLEENMAAAVALYQQAKAAGRKPNCG